MNYPIDIERHLEAVHLNMETDAVTDEFVRRYVSLVNNAYNDGKAGKLGYPMDPETEIFRRSQNLGISTTDDLVVETVSCIIRWMNDAYAHGARDAKTEAA